MSERLKRLYLKLFELEPTLPGSISEQYNVCGKANCRCKDEVAPRKHGPQLKLGFTLCGKSSTLVIKKADKDVALLMNEHFQQQRELQIAINDETLSIYKELGAEGAYAQIDQALSEAKAEALGAASGTAELKRLEKSRDKWKEKAKERNDRLQKNSVRIRDLVISRDKWKDKATSLKSANKVYERQVADLQRIKTKCEATIADLELQVKKGRS
jgi:hypothetical protein